MQAIGHTGKLQNKGDFVTGKIAGTSYVVVRGEDMQLRAFHNVSHFHNPLRFSLSCQLPLLQTVSVIQVLSDKPMQTSVCCAKVHCCHHMQRGLPLD